MSTPQSLTHSQIDFVNNDFEALAPTCAIAHVPTGDGSRCEATCSGYAHSLQAGSSRWLALRLPVLVWGCSPSLEGGRP
jgi:hypothetical protein